MDKVKLLSAVIVFILYIVFLVGFIFLSIALVINILDENEDREWDGSELNTGVRDVKLFEDSEEIIVKCTKVQKETDVMIERDSLLNKGTMDKDYWNSKIDELKSAIDSIENPTEEYAMGISHTIRFLKLNQDASRSVSAP